MAAKPTRRVGSAASATETALERFFATEARNWLAHPNVVGVMLGRKRVAGEDIDADAIIFRVERKLGDRGEILAIGSKPLPDTLRIGDRDYPTDVIEGAHRATLDPAAADPRRRFPFICAGVSIGNAGVAGDAGTGTAVVRHVRSGRLALLSCDHVLGRRDGTPLAIQPGRGDRGGANDVFGKVIAGMREFHGDAALALIERRPAELRVPGLGIAFDRVDMPKAGDLVIKAGRTTGVTYGVVCARMATMLVRYLDSEPIDVNGFEITALDGGSTMAGDSGSPWLLADRASKQPTGTLVGIHTATTPDGQGAFACFAPAVFARLGIELARPTHLADLAAPAAMGDLMRVTARSGLAVRAGADRAFERQHLLPFGTVVRRLGVHGDWTKVDVQGDGAADGFAYSPFLEPAGSTTGMFDLGPAMIE